MTDEAIITYDITPKKPDGMNIRPAHNVDNVAVGTLEFGEHLTGDQIYEVQVAGEATNARVGDKWLRLLPLSPDPNKQRWIAIRHKDEDLSIVKNISTPVGDDYFIHVEGEVQTIYRKVA